MKKFFFAAFAACLAVLATSCQGHLDNQTGDESGLLYGAWKFDAYKIEASGTSNGNDFTIPLLVTYKLKETTFVFGEDLVVWAHMGWETKSAKYSFDNEKKQFTLGKMLEVSDDGRIVVLAGTFDVETLTEDTLVLKQPYDPGLDIDFGVPIPSKAVATYTFSRKK